MRPPDYCTSKTCKKWGSDHCPFCSHGIYKGEGCDGDGKKWYWKYNYITGPTFIFDTGEKMKRQPPNILAWNTFYRWIIRGL